MKLLNMATEEEYVFTPSSDDAVISRSSSEWLEMPVRRHHNTLPCKLARPLSATKQRCLYFLKSCITFDSGESLQSCAFISATVIVRP